MTQPGYMPFPAGTSRHPDNDLEIVDDDDAPSSTAPAAHTPGPRSAIPSRRQKDVIEDSDDTELPRDAGTQRGKTSELIDDAIESSPPCDPGTTEVFEDGFDELFAPVRGGKKRQRLSAGKPSLEEKLREESDQIELSTPGPQQATTTELPQSPAPRPTPSAMAAEPGVQTTPMAPPRLARPAISTPTPMDANTPFRSKPRFMLSAKKPPSSQPVFNPDMPTPSQPASPPERRKPAFVLPRSPPPDAANEDIPVPFSPSSRTLHRRGHPRSGVPGYTPGGMAAEVRSWILEMGSKREQIALAPASIDRDHLTRYHVAARVAGFSQTTLSSSGPLAFIQAETLAETSADDEAREVINIMAMGAPRSRPPAEQSSRADTALLQAGDLIGIHRGLTWEVDLQTSLDLPAGLEDHAERFEPSDSAGSDRRWLIAMQWDLVQTSP